MADITDYDPTGLIVNEVTQIRRGVDASLAGANSIIFGPGQTSWDGETPVTRGEPDPLTQDNWKVEGVTVVRFNTAELDAWAAKQKELTRDSQKVQIRADTERLYGDGMPWQPAAQPKVYAFILNESTVSGRMDVNDTHQSKLAGERVAPYYFLTIDGQPIILSDDLDQQTYWNAVNDQTSAIIGTHVILIDRLDALALDAVAGQQQVLDDSANRTADNVFDTFLQWLPQSALMRTALGQVTRKNAAITAKPVQINGHEIAKDEIRDLHEWLSSGEDDYPYWLPTIDDEPQRINTESQARAIVKRLAERVRHTRRDGRPFIRDIRRATTREQIRVAMAANNQR